MLTLLDYNATTVLGNVQDALAATLNEKINGDKTLTVDLPANSTWASQALPGRVLRSEGQLYRIRDISKEDDGTEQTLALKAPHVFFDLESSTADDLDSVETNPDGITAYEALARVLDGTPFSLGTVDVDHTRLGDLNIFQKPRTEGLKQIVEVWGGELEIDNFTVGLRQRLGAKRQYPIRAGKNMLGIDYKESLGDTVTRLHIRGYGGKDYVSQINDGKDYIDSPYLNSYGTMLERYVDFNDEDDPKVLLAMAREHLDTVDKPSISVSVDLAYMVGSPQYAWYKDLEAFDLGDIGLVHHNGLSIDLEARCIGRTRDALTGVNTDVQLGDPIKTIATAITGAGSTAAKLGNILNSDGSLRADKVSGGLDLLLVNNLVASVVDIVTASIGSATITQAQIDQLKARTVTIVEAEIQQMNVDWANISELTTAIANITLAKIKTADIGFGQVKDLVAQEAIITKGVGGQIYISRLQVTDANMVSLTTGKLVVKGEDGKYYQITVGEDGTIAPVEVKIEGGNIEDGTVTGPNLIENAISARELNAQAIFADQATMISLFAGMGRFGEIFAASAVMPHITASVIESNALKISVTDTAKDLIGLRVEIVSTSDILSEEIKEITLTAKVWQGKTDVTDTLNARCFAWKRTTADETADRLWNAAHKGVKTITQTVQDVWYSATYTCEIEEE